MNQFRKQTRIGIDNRPKAVHLLNLQKKGNKGNKEIIIKNFKRGEEEKLRKIKNGKRALSSRFTFSKV